MSIRGLVHGVPVWLVTGPDPARGRWLHLEEFPDWRIRGELELAA